MTFITDGEVNICNAEKLDNGDTRITVIDEIGDVVKFVGQGDMREFFAKVMVELEQLYGAPV